MRSFVPRSPAKGTDWATGCSQVGLLEPVIPADDACRDAVLACGQSKLALRIEIQRHSALSIGFCAKSNHIVCPVCEN